MIPTIAFMVVMPSWICAIMLEDTNQTWTPLVETINAKMEFMPLDAELAANTLRLVFFQQEDYLPASTSSSCVCSKERVNLQHYNSIPLIWTVESHSPPVCTHERCVTTALVVQISYSSSSPTVEFTECWSNSSSTANNGCLGRWSHGRLQRLLHRLNSQ